MKKIILASVMTVFTTGVYAQAIDAQVKETQCKLAIDNIAKAEKATQDPKKGIKSATWVKLAETQLEMALDCGKDSLASEKAYNTYQKAIEIEKAAGGKGIKDIETAMSGTASRLYISLMQQGAGFYNAKNFKNALNLFKLASNTSPKDTMSTLYAGIVAQQSQSLDDAKNYFGKFIEQGGKDIAVFYGLSELYKNDKEHAKAIEILKKGIATNPKDKDLQSSLINAYLSGGMMNEAIEMMKQRVSSTPNTPENAKNLSEDLKNLGTLYENGAGEFERKIRPIESEMNQAIREKNEGEKELANVEGKKLAQEEELKRLNERLKKEPKNAATIKGSIASVTQMILSANSEVEAAKQKIARATQTVQNSSAKEAELVSLRAKETELKDLAVSNYKKSLEVDPSNFDANYNLGVYYFNSAVIAKGVVDKMDMKTYNEKGKAIEEQVCITFNQSKEYFDKCKSLKADDQDTNSNLDNLKGVLEQCAKRK